MKKFLLFCAGLGLSASVCAQINNEQGQWGVDNAFAADISVDTFYKPISGDEAIKTENNLMPDVKPLFDVDPFAGAKQNQQLGEKNVNTVKNVVQPTPQALPEKKGVLFPELGDTQSKQQKDGASVIKLIIDDVRIVQPPLNGNAFCRGTLIMENQLNVRVQKMDLNLNYGGLDVPVSFANVAPLGGTQKQAIAWIGTYCNSMLSIPQITVKACAVSTLSREACQSMLEYQPIENK